MLPLVSTNLIHRFYSHSIFDIKGSCADLLCAHQFGIRESLIAHIMWQLLQALRYLQDRYIIHR